MLMLSRRAAFLALLDLIAARPVDVRERRIPRGLERSCRDLVPGRIALTIVDRERHLHPFAERRREGHLFGLLGVASLLGRPETRMGMNACFAAVRVREAAHFVVDELAASRVWRAQQNQLRESLKSLPTDPAYLMPVKSSSPGTR